MSNVKFDDREAWLTEAANLILDDVVMPHCSEKERPNFRISVGFPKHSRGGKAIAVCFVKEASSDGVNEIFINPEIDDVIRVMDCITHELIHAVDNRQSGHKGFFARVARACDLQGPLTDTTAGQTLKDTLEGFEALLGDFPHAKMTTDKVHKKDGTRQLKVWCDNDECGFLFRTSGKQQAKLGMRHSSLCPACSKGSLTWD